LNAPVGRAREVADEQRAELDALPGRRTTSPRLGGASRGAKAFREKIAERQSVMEPTKTPTTRIGPAFPSWQR
jgi:hypothetical protein